MTTRYRLLCAYAHPDDEQGVSGLMHKYANEGVEVTLVCATRGEAGEIAPGVDATPTNLGQVREEELRCAAEKIGVHNVYFLDYRDSGMMGTPENSDPRAFWNANPLEATERLVRIIRRHKPQVITTFDPNGGYGHPDHIKIHQTALMAYFISGDPRIFPEQIEKEGLLPWTISKLYWGAFARSRFAGWAEYAEKHNLKFGVPIQEFMKRAMPDEIITTRIDVTSYVDLKFSALSCHASQLNPNSTFAQIPPEIRREGMKVETLVRAESRVVVTEPETDLFVGVE
ncbi:MAG: PIG-L family deacetylase [Chloroflexi bacterium]|nr:PIG-L family deacetylase [Chloroflexota bacterium]